MPDNTKPSFHPLFDDEDAEIILSSNEGMLFRLPRFTLKKASGYFRNIFTNQSTSVDQQHVIPFPTEPVEHVLLMISGLPATPPSIFDKIEAVINVMQHLDTQGPLNTFRRHILPNCRDQPIKLYGLGVKLGWPELEQRGAELTFPINLLQTGDSTITSQLSQLPAPILLNLLELHQRRKTEFSAALKHMPEPQVQCDYCDAEHVTWQLLISRLTEEIQSDCSGSRILGPEIEAWEESKGCWVYRCTRAKCHGRYARANTLDVIRLILNGLPKAVSSEKH